MSEIPNPGSREAIKQGCKCPVMDNRYGRGIGAHERDGRPLFVQSADCPLHGARNWQEKS